MSCLGQPSDWADIAMVVERCTGPNWQSDLRLGLIVLVLVALALSIALAIAARSR